jgi:haloalkane dehalogenase
MTSDAPIATDFPYESRYVDVVDSRMHYIEQGEGDPILLLHGNPTSSYLWRNVIPHLAPHGRCIAPDLIGMGKSDKPDIPYRFFDHAKYLDAFIDELGLDRVTLVVHDWGSGLGFYWAARHQERVRAIAFMEALVKPLKWDDFPKDFKMGFTLMRAPVIGWAFISGMNFFIDRIMPQSVVRPLTEVELDQYRAPYPTAASRQPIRQWPREIPIDGKPADVLVAFEEYGKYLRTSEIPKLMLHARPGGIITPEVAQWCRDTMPNLDAVDVGEGVHYLQEDNPHGIGEAIAAWYQGLPGESA